jgi:hypothetical protein
MLVSEYNCHASLDYSQKVQNNFRGIIIKTQLSIFR